MEEEYFVCVDDTNLVGENIEYRKVKHGSSVNQR
jgi:hypothetical protein